MVSLVYPLPSNDILCRCFVINFQENEMYYNEDMLGLEVGSCLRLDHTFKVASNIGYLRPDGKWITQYGSVFLVLNNQGQVLTWQLTNSTSLDEVTPLLNHLKDRMQCNILTIYVDNCCHVRQKLQQIFGNNTVIKLDIFHAVQRVTRALPKRHTLFYQCMREFRMVFRYQTDVSKKKSIGYSRQC